MRARTSGETCAPPIRLSSRSGCAKQHWIPACLPSALKLSINREMKKKHTMHFDEFDHIEYRGWAWSPSDETSSPRVDLIINCGATTLGRKRRNIPRPDIDSYMEDPSGDKGFALPIVPFVFLGQILGDAESFAPIIHLADKEVSATELPP